MGIYQNKSTASWSPPLVFHDTAYERPCGYNYGKKEFYCIFLWHHNRAVASGSVGQVFGIDRVFDCSDWPESNIHFLQRERSFRETVAFQHLSLLWYRFVCILLILHFNVS